MKKFDSEVNELFTINLKYASSKEILCLIWWDLFYPHKRNKLIDCLQRGMTWKFAFKNAKKFKK